jgi:hypothetical protein
VTALRSLVSKSSVQAIVALTVIGVASYLAIVRQIDGPTYFGLAVIVVGYFFRSGAPTSPDK